MADQYRVDLSELDNVVKRLNSVTKDMQSTKGDAKSSTYLPAGALGTGFAEADDLYKAHEVMKQQIEEIIDHLNDVMDDFGKKTVQTRGAYEDSEYEARSGMTGGY